MRDAIDVTVQRTIVHLIKHLKQDLVQSDEELALNGDGKLRAYFSDQVKNALNDSQTGSARLSRDGNPEAAVEAYKILTDPNSFISSSQQLARLLLAAMGTDARIKAASLAVCLYTASNYPSTEFLALIKIDPTEALIEKVETRSGKQIVSFEVRSDVMPTAREKLQKAALIPRKGTVKGLDLLLLDRQVAAMAANFFAYKFLNAAPATDARTSTQAFYVATQNAYNRLVISPPEAPEHIGPEVADALAQHLDVALQSPAVKFDSWLKNLPVQTEAVAVVANEIQKEFPEEKQIKIDKQFARDKLLNKRRFRGKYGVVFEVESDHYKDVVKEKTDLRGPDGKTITRLVIEVPDLKWVK